jgi:solute carrier family 10 (sodium/bile acid cotransporter), member 7
MEHRVHSVTTSRVCPSRAFISTRRCGCAAILHVSAPRIRKKSIRVFSRGCCTAAARDDRDAGLQTGVEPFSIQKFVDNNFIPLALLSAASFGWIFPKPGEIAVSMKLQKFSTVGQFVISGMVLQANQVASAIKSPLPLLYGIISILFVTPLLGIAIMNTPWIQPFEFKIGMTVFCCVPTTLSSCVALANACNGNAAVALMLVVMTSTLGVFTIPCMLSFVLGSTSLGQQAFDQRELLKSLIVSVLLPLFVGIGLQRIRNVADWKDKNKKLLSRMSTMFLCLTPWMQLSIASAANLPIGPGMVLTALALGIGVHVVFLAFNMVTTAGIRFNTNENENNAIRKAIILCTSEKTLPVAVAVISQLKGILGSAMAFAVLPCIFSHIVQTIIDSALVSHWNTNDAHRRRVA